MKYSERSAAWLRTFLINIITASVARGLALNRRRNQEIAPREWSEGIEAPYVQIIAPLRNEESNVAALMQTLLAQEYPADRWGITLVDDGSTDATRHIAENITRNHIQATVITARPLPPRWTGKSNAMYSGYVASPPDADWLLFVDADTRHHPLTLASVVQRAIEQDADLLSLVITVKTESFWERVLVPQMGELYTLLVGTMDQVNEGGLNSSAAANGQFMLVRRSIFGELGSLEKVRGDVAEDRALAASMKERGYNVRLEYGRQLVSARVYTSFKDMWNGYIKTLFWASGHNTLRAIGVVSALSIYAFLPVASVVASSRSTSKLRKDAISQATIQVLPMLAVRVAVCRQMGIPARYALTYPLGVAVGNAMLLYSMYRVLSGKGVAWKGRTYRKF